MEMSLSMEQMKDWVEDLAGKIRDLQAKIRELEEENKALKLMNQELTDKAHVETGRGEVEEVNSPPLENEQRSRPGVSNQGMPADFRMNTVTTKTNPMEIETVVRHLMGFMGPMDLLKCRQVSKLWKNGAQKDFQERVTFHIDNYHLYRIRKFMECAGNGFPKFRNLRLDLYVPGPVSMEDLCELFVSYGKSLHKLHLNFGENFYDYWRSRDIFLGHLEDIRVLEIQAFRTSRLHGNQKFLDQLNSKVFQNLSVLKLGLSRTDPISVGYNSQIFLGLLQMAPNLKTLSWGWRRSEEDHQCTQFIQSLIEVNPAKLENLFIHNSIPESAVESLANSPLKLHEHYLPDYKKLGLKSFSTQSGTSGADITLHNGRLFSRLPSNM